MALFMCRPHVAAVCFGTCPSWPWAESLPRPLAKTMKVSRTGLLLDISGVVAQNGKAWVSGEH